MTQSVTKTLDFTQLDPISPQSLAPKVVILGAGPAGLAAACDLMQNGYPVILLEKRQKEADGRKNTVLIQRNLIANQTLNEHGVYGELVNKKLIHSKPNEPYAVRLCDLESVYREKFPKSIIHYRTQLTGIKTTNDISPATLVIEDQKGDISEIRDVNFVINAEGANSSTNQLLENHRIEVLPKIPVIAAISEDERAYKDMRSSFSSIFKTFYYISATIYYHAIYFFMFILWGERLFNSKRNIAGSLILKTPGQHYIGLGFMKEKSEMLSRLYQNVQESKPNAQKELDSFVRFWASLSLCRINALALVSLITCKSIPRQFASWLPLKHFSVTHIGADCAENNIVQKGGTPFLIIGDALATVDPTTGLGCNVAIHFGKVASMTVRSYSEGYPNVLYDFSDLARRTIEQLHHVSKESRLLYRPAFPE